MKFNECLDLALATGKIKQDKADLAKKVYKDAYDAIMAAGGTSERAADDLAASEAAERLRKLTSAKKRQVIAEIRVSADIHELLHKNNRPDLEVRKLGNNIDVTAQRIRADTHKIIYPLLELGRVRAGGLVSGGKVKDLKDVIRALYGENVRPSIKAVADAITAADVWLRNRANMEGTSIPTNKNRRLGQTQERFKLREHLRKLGDAESRAQYTRDHLEHGDWDLILYEGKTVPLADRPAVLMSMYDAVITNGDNRVVPGHRGQEGLATRMGHERFFYYKNAESWLAMQEKYGSGDVFQQVVSMVEIMARDIATLEHLGPNPTAMLNYINNLLKKRSADFDKGNFSAKSMSHRTKTEFEAFVNGYNLHNNLINSGDESALVQTMGSIRTLSATAVLSFSSLSQAGDIGFAKNAMLLNGIPTSGYIRRLAKNFIGMPFKEIRGQAVRAGMVFDSAMSIALTMQRQLGPLDGHAWAKRVSDAMFRQIGMTPLTTAARWAWFQHVTGSMADFARTKFEKLPFRESLEGRGITAADWDMMRGTTIDKSTGSTFLRPMDLAARADLDPVVAQRTADKFVDWILWMGREAVPTVDTETLVTLGRHIPANTLLGQFGRVGSSVKGFVTVMMLVHLRSVMAAPTIGGKIGRGARLVAIMTLAGAFITQMKELAHGRNPMDMNPVSNPAFWMRSALNGGSFGIFGDVLFGSINAYGGHGGGFSDVLLGPPSQFLDDVLKLSVKDSTNFIEALIAGQSVSEAAKTAGFAKDAVKFGAKWTPIPWQFRVLLEAAVIDDLILLTDPKAAEKWRRDESRRLELYGQRFWRPHGKKPSMPNLGSAWGGER